MSDTMKSRNIRVDDKTWQEFGDKCREEREPIAIVLRRLMRAYVNNR